MAIPARANYTHTRDLLPKRHRRRFRPAPAFALAEARDLRDELAAVAFAKGEPSWKVALALGLSERTIRRKIEALRDAM